MSHYYGTLQGGGKQVTRRGFKARGLETVAASWEGAVKTELYHKDGRDYAKVQLVPWHGKGCVHLIYDGLVGGGEVL